ncbi:MAG TPA: MBL fold metallo-hydrolase [Gemmatimonadales bacterium]|nr:MBL fold metallo-hydrolase [Gemmatimonadales bacterium]
MTTVAPGTSLLDLEYLGRPGHIGIYCLETSEGLAVVDTGPASTLSRFQDGIRALGATLSDVRIVLATHIHMDHTGAVGQLAEANPRLKVYVHERGAPHLADPSRLVRSASMVYGEENMLRLHGEVKPVPADHIVPLAGGETLDFGDRRIASAYTPGHAWHHIAWLDELTGTAFTGEALGDQVGLSEVPIPVTPPPDVDLEALLASGERIMDWRPSILCPTHFGPVMQPIRFAEEHARRLVLWSERVRTSLFGPGTDEEKAKYCRDLSWQDLTALIPPEFHQEIEEEAIYGNWFGLARYWRKKAPTP